MRSLFPHARALFGSVAALAAVLAVGVAVHAQGAAPAAAPAAAPPAAAPPAAGPPAAAAAAPPQPLTEEVVAHVNDEVITNYDIIQRMRVRIASRRSQAMIIPRNQSDLQGVVI